MIPRHVLYIYAYMLFWIGNNFYLLWQYFVWSPFNRSPRLLFDASEPEKIKTKLPFDRLTSLNCPKATVFERYILFSKWMCLWSILGWEIPLMWACHKRSLAQVKIEVPFVNKQICLDDRATFWEASITHYLIYLK